ncbi:MAG: dihydropteroate synthase [Verrucomicrobiales bacterium]
MGIANVTDDSFCGDGTLDLAEAMRHAVQMAADGADIIDVGAESARTNREAIPVEEEIGRLLPFIDCFTTACAEVEPRDDLQIWPPLLSVNTWRPEVVEAVLKTGKIDIVNDMGGMPDDANARLCSEYGAALLIMHTAGLPKEPHTDRHYEDVWASLESFFEDRVARALAAGLDKNQIILDPGIDFAKQRDDNLRIYRELERLVAFDLPILLPISRKTVIGEVLGIDEPDERDAGTIACLIRGLVAQANVFRVHRVKAIADSVRVIAAIRSEALHSSASSSRGG